jgi:predicted DNA-binding WGR domain protein
MTPFQDFLHGRIESGGFTTEDCVASIVPLIRETLDAHAEGFVAPLEGLAELRVEGSRIWYAEGRRITPRDNVGEVRRIESVTTAAVEIVDEVRRITELDVGQQTILNLAIGDSEKRIDRPLFLAGYVTWEHAMGHHDVLTDVFSIGMLLASLACGMDFSEPDDLAAFVSARRNLFDLNPTLHPVLARMIVKMTEIDRHRRAQDLSGVLATLQNYREQQVDLDSELARIKDFDQQDTHSKQSVVLGKLRDRLFDLSKRNRLLHFRPTMQSINLTHASVPLSFDIKNIRPDQLLVWSDELQSQLASGKPLSLNRYLNFNEALYLPSVLDRTIAEARRDEAEYGFAQLRLVACFLHWANLKSTPVEQFDSPLILVPVVLKKKKGIRDTYVLEATDSEAEVNPVIRHQFKQLYDIDLPVTVDLNSTTLDEFFEHLSRRIESSSVSVALTKIDRPRIALIHEKARLKLDQYRRRARLSGRGVRRFMDLDYSYDSANYHPLGLKLFAARVRTTSTHLRDIIEEKPRPRTFATAEPDSSAEKERSFFSLHEGGEANPYSWTFDLCSVTLANFKYRKMSLVRDYESLVSEQPVNPAFEATFSLQPRYAGRRLPAAPPLAERFDVVPCDPTQATAIEEARLGASYIIQGPPGTGKSQTITNLIADYVARGKRVLFVCEKRAAIDVVYARLRHCGLGDLCCLIHDSQTDKKQFVADLKQSYESYLNGTESSNVARSDRSNVLNHLAATLGELEAFDTAMHAAPPDAGVMVRKLIERCIVLGDHAPELSPLETERLPDYGTWWRCREHVSRFNSALAEIQADGVLAHHPLSMISPRVASEEQPLALVTRVIERALHGLDQIESALSRSGIPRDVWTTLEQASSLVDYAACIHPISRVGQMRLLDVETEEARQFGGELQQLRELEDKLSQARAGTANWRSKIPASDLPTALAQARLFEGQWFSWLKPAWWRLRSILNGSYDFRGHVVRPGWVQVLSALETEYQRQSAFDTMHREIARRHHAEGALDTFLARVETARTFVRDIPKWLVRVHAALIKSEKAPAVIERIAAASDTKNCLMQELASIADDFVGIALSELRERLSAIANSVQMLPIYLQCVGELAAVPQKLSTAVRSISCSVPSLEAAVARRTLGEVYLRDRRLQRFTAIARKQHAEHLEVAYDRWQVENAKWIRDQVRQRFLENVRISGSPAAQLTAEQKEFKQRYSRGRRELEHEFGKSMRYKPIRDLVSGDSGEVVKDLKPVWLMSPLSVSDTLPLDTNRVDVVIFDEASQITLEEAVPALFRANQAIVVGDEMQLPPTDFFSTSRSDDDEEIAFEDDGELVQYDLESNSFLNHTAKNLPSTMLGWHYRSRSESLISFSNWAFYDGRLLTVPEESLADERREPIRASGAEDGSHGAIELLARPISFHFIETGVYDKRRNRPEAEYIAHLVRRLLADGSGRTIAVIAFSETQQAEIEESLKQLASEDVEFAGRLEAEYEREEDGQFVGLLVKNLENIQGDERDIVILSVCYGFDPQRKIRMNFGPINKSGGEKRLNVAFSRAKHHMAIVSSIRHSDITNDYNDGANCLKQYLRYAEALSSGDPVSATRVLHGMSRWHESAKVETRGDDVVVDQLAAELTRRGYRVDRSVGQSHFRCDLAVRKEGDTAYRLGILVDTAEYYDQSDLIEREMMRPKLLRLFGWRITHVLAKDWQAERRECLARILRLLEEKAAETTEGADCISASHCEVIPSNDRDQLVERPAGCDEGDELIEATVVVGGLDNVDLDYGDLPKVEQLEPAAMISDAPVIRRYFEFKSETSNKFWEITLSDSTHTVRFGRIGTQGQSQTKSFADAEAAKSDCERLVREKLAKGYEDRSPPSDGETARV